MHFLRPSGRSRKELWIKGIHTNSWKELRIKAKQLAMVISICDLNVSVLVRRWLCSGDGSQRGKLLFAVCAFWQVTYLCSPGSDFFSVTKGLICVIPTSSFLFVFSSAHFIHTLLVPDIQL